MCIRDRCRPECTISGSFAAPSGSWAMILLNYTGEARGNVFDSAYSLFVNGVDVFQGTSPEYGRWSVLKDITEYTALFKGTVNFVFHVPGAIIQGNFTTWLSISFYPVPKGETPPSEPNVILPLWSGVSLTQSSPSATLSVNVPYNTLNATLELYAYGFGLDEFWYTNEPSFRDVIVSVDSKPIASVLPFPYINTGGIDLFAWRPITAVFTLDDPAYRLDVTPALGLLEGEHELSVQVLNIFPASRWIISGALLLYTSPNTPPAKQVSYSFNGPVVATATNPSFTYFNQTANISYSYSSKIGDNLYTLESSQSFANNQTFNQIWENITGYETTRTVTTNTGPESSLISKSITTTYYPLRMDTGFVFTVTSTTNGGFPIYGTFSILLYNLLQGWVESEVSVSPASANPSHTLLNDTVTVTNGVTSGNIELISPSAGIITAITFISANTTKSYMLVSRPAAPYKLFAHTIVGSSYQPQPPYFAETVTTNRILGLLG